MTTRDRHPEDVPTLTEVGPRAGATNERWQQPEWAPPSDDRPAAHREPGVRAADEPSDRDYSDQVAPEGDYSNSDVQDDRRDSEQAAEQAPDTSLFADDELAGLRARWDNVQAGFVDDPKECVTRADGLVSDVVKQLTTGFTEARSRLESQWARGEEATTEDLRVALKRYRDFFDRLLSV